MGVGRYFCVALPFILTVASIIAALIVGLTGVSSNGLYLFRIDVSNLTIDVAELQGLINNASSIASGKALDDFTDGVSDKAQQAGEDIRNSADKIGDDVTDKAQDIGSDVTDKAQDIGNDISNKAQDVGDSISDKVNDIVNRSPLDWHDASMLKAASAETETEEKESEIPEDVINLIGSKEIKGSDLGLAKYYDFTLWGYCITPQEGKRNCTKAQFDWASKELDLEWLHRLSAAAELNVTLPKELDDGLTAYKTVTKWAEVVFIIAIVALGLELVVGLFTACSRAVSCITWVISGFATAAMIAFASLLTATGAVVVGVVVGASKHYGGKAHLNTSFLAVLWLGVAFALGASFFWLFSVCCCKPENRPHARGMRHSDDEKLIPNGSYAPIGENRASAYSGYNNYAPNNAPQRGGARSDLAYEPYSHSRV